jgi:hypothetical protein
MPSRVTVGSDIHFRNIARQEAEAVLKELGFSWSEEGLPHPAPGTMMVEVDDPGESEEELFSEADEDLLEYAQAILPKGYPFPGTVCPFCGSDDVDVGSQDAPDSWASVKACPKEKVVVGHSVPLACNDCGSSGRLMLDARWTSPDGEKKACPTPF